MCAAAGIVMSMKRETGGSVRPDMRHQTTLEGLRNRTKPMNQLENVQAYARIA